jgi:hypothetical protein
VVTSVRNKPTTPIISYYQKTSFIIITQQHVACPSPFPTQGYHHGQSSHLLESGNQSKNALSPENEKTAQNSRMGETH